MRIKVGRAARLLVRRNFTTRGMSKRVAALRYVPPVVTSVVDNHSVDPVLLGNIIRDMMACEALSFTGQLVILVLSVYAKSVSRNLSITCEKDICEVEWKDAPDTD